MRTDPWGDVRADWRIGQLAALVGNMFRDKGRPALKPSDFILDTDPPEPQSVEDMQGTFKLAGDLAEQAKRG